MKRRAILLCFLCAVLLGGVHMSGALSTDSVAADGSYTASGKVDFDWDLYTFDVTVTVSGGQIASISQAFTSAPYEPDSDEYYHPRAMTRLKNDLLGKPAAAASVDANAVDAVSGATYSYRALRDAVRSALENAPEAQGEEPAVRYSVFYDLNGAPGDAPEALTYKPGTTVSLMDDPVWKHHRFTGWSGIDAAGGSFRMPEEDVTLTANWINSAAAAPGSVRTVVPDGGACAVTLDYSEQAPRGTYRLLYALYDASGQMRQIFSAPAVFDGSFSFDVSLPNLQPGEGFKAFLLREDGGTPLCAPAELRFASKFPDGVYRGSAQCLTGYINYPVDLDVTVENGVITGVADRTLRLPMSARDKELYGKAWREISRGVAAARFEASAFDAVDAVSGATISSRAINEAIDVALTEQAAPADTALERYAPEGISLYGRMYPIVTVSKGAITDIRIVPVKDTDVRALSAFAQQILERQSVTGLDWPEEIRDDAFELANLIDQTLYGKDVLR